MSETTRDDTEETEAGWEKVGQIGAFDMMEFKRGAATAHNSTAPASGPAQGTEAPQTRRKGHRPAELAELRDDLDEIDKRIAENNAVQRSDADLVFYRRLVAEAIQLLEDDYNG